MKKKSTRKQPYFRQPLFLAGCALVAASAIFVVLELTNTIDFINPSTQTPTSQTTVVEDNGDPQSKIDLSPATPSDNAETNKKKESDPNTSTPTTSGTPQVVATNARLNDNTVHIGTLVSGVSSGTCTANFVLQSDNSKKFSVDSAVTFQGNTYTCGSLDATKNQFPQSGTYAVHVTLSSGGKTAQSEYNPTVTIP